LKERSQRVWSPQCSEAVIYFIELTIRTEGCHTLEMH